MKGAEGVELRGGAVGLRSGSRFQLQRAGRKREK